MKLGSQIRYCSPAWPKSIDISKLEKKDQFSSTDHLGGGFPFRKAMGRRQYAVADGLLKNRSDVEPVCHLFARAPGTSIHP